MMHRLGSKTIEEEIQSIKNVVNGSKEYDKKMRLRILRATLYHILVVIVIERTLRE